MRGQLYIMPSQITMASHLEPKEKLLIAAVNVAGLV
jgi:hypothetical protein